MEPVRPPKRHCPVRDPRQRWEEYRFPPHLGTIRAPGA
jgi:hypothetical protein